MEEKEPTKHKDEDYNDNEGYENLDQLMDDRPNIQPGNPEDVDGSSSDDSEKGRNNDKYHPRSLRGKSPSNFELK